MGVSLLGGYPGRFRMMLLSWIVERNSRLAESSDMIKDASRQKWGFQTLYSDALNIAYARWLAHAVNYPEAIIRMGEPDTHFYGKFDFDDVHANHLMRVVSYVEGECINKSPKGLLDALFKAKRGQGVHADYYAYAQMDREKGHLVFEESREPTRGETREEQLKYITNYGMGLFNVIIPDIVKRAFIMTGLPFSRTFYLLSKFMKE